MAIQSRPTVHGRRARYDAAAEHEAAIVDSADRDQFKTAMNARLKALGTSHVAFFHDSRPRAAGRVAIAATCLSRC
jgi:hypothetical protein